MANTGHVGGAIPFYTFDRDTTVKYHPSQARCQGLSNALMSLEERQHKHQDRIAHVPQSQGIVSKLLKISASGSVWKTAKKVATTVNITHTHIHTVDLEKNGKEWARSSPRKIAEQVGMSCSSHWGSQARGPGAAALQAPLRRRSPHDPRQPPLGRLPPGGPGPRERGREKKGLRTPCPCALLPLSDGELPRDSQDGAQGGQPRRADTETPRSAPGAPRVLTPLLRASGRTPSEAAGSQAQGPTSP